MLRRVRPWGVLFCVCGHERDAHRHYRAGSNCALCDCYAGGGQRHEDSVGKQRREAGRRNLAVDVVVAGSMPETPGWLAPVARRSRLSEPVRAFRKGVPWCGEAGTLRLGSQAGSYGALLSGDGDYSAAPRANKMWVRVTGVTNT